MENKKEGQKQVIFPHRERQMKYIEYSHRQIFFLADAGKDIADLENSVFVEKLTARGYEVLLLNQPIDEILLQNVKHWRSVLET